MEMARRAIDAFYRGAVAEFDGMVDERFEFVEAADVPDAIRFTGSEWYAELIRHLSEVWADPPGRFQEEELIDLGEDVIVRGRLTLRGKTSGVSVASEIAIRLEFSRGKLIRGCNHPTEEAARAASRSCG